MSCHHCEGEHHLCLGRQGGVPDPGRRGHCRDAGRHFRRCVRDGAGSTQRRQNTAGSPRRVKRLLSGLRKTGGPVFWSGPLVSRPPVCYNGSDSTIFFYRKP